jgi:Cys-tRNA(Pro)/Cys-tRNA(Cys) deacylase
MKEQKSNNKEIPMQKTNALRMLDKMKIPYRTYHYDAPDGFLDGVSVAEATGLDPRIVFKTLVLQGTSRGYFVCLLPVALELDLKKAAKYFSEKKLDMIPAKEITTVTGYVKGGCSPVGMKKQFPTAVDQSAVDYETIVVSAGRVGLQMELSVDGLLDAVGAGLADLTVEGSDV